MAINNYFFAGLQRKSLTSEAERHKNTQFEENITKLKTAVKKSAKHSQ